MPYIDKQMRHHIQFGNGPINSGELNYLITSMLIAYLNKLGKVSYQRINDCLGALEGAKMEFYRRIVVPYEEKKMKENGDVYDTE